ncbi:MAG: tubulin-like doman-containing protein [Pyrinomonadaceae bacterium]
MSDQIIIRGKAEVKPLQEAPVKPTVIIGIGGSGGDILLRVRKRFYEKYGPLAQFPIVSYLWIDTDATEKDVGAGIFTEQIAFAPSEKLMTTMADTTKVTNDLNQHPHIKRWFYPGLTKLQTMTEGAGQIRAYSRLGFFEHYTKIRNAISHAGSTVRNIENIRTVREKHHLETNIADLQVFVVFSLAGGTGSGMFLDLAFLIKNIFEGNALTTVGFILMPGLFNPNEDRVFANGYAALKELEYYSYEHKFEVEWSDGVERKIPGPPFSYTYLIDRVNNANNNVDFSTREIIFNMVAENIFKDFTQGNFAGYKRGVRVNLDQYMVDQFAFRHLNEHRESIIDQKFITRYSSFGMASITVPADRIEQACAYKLGAEVVDHWGRLSHGEFNASRLTEIVFTDLLPKIRLFEGNLSAQGAIEQRHDIQNALLDDGRKQGQKIQNLITQAVGQTAREVRDGVHRQKGQSLAQYLRAGVERELGKLRNDKQDPQQWGDYSRAVHFNKEELADTSQKLLYKEIGRVVNEEHQSVGYAIALLRQMANVMRDENREYIPALQRLVERTIKEAEESRRRLDHLLAEIARHEMRSNWDGRKGTILRYDIQRFEELAPRHLNAVLLTQVRIAAIEICTRLIAYIGMAESTEGGEMYKEGLIGELYTLGGQLENLKRRLEVKYEHFKEPTKSDLSLMLYNSNDIEANYLPKYLGTGERRTQQVQSIGDQILQELRTSVMDLPRVMKQHGGMEAIETQIRDLARKPFDKLKQDFDVLDTLWKKYPDEAELESQVRFIYKKAKFWLHGGNRPRSYVLSPERHKILVGVPQHTADMTKLEDFKRLLNSRITEPGDPALSIQELPDRSEIVFYSEVGGIPINWANPIPEYRQKYISKQAEGEELHTDHNEIKFDDLVVLDDRERAELEEAHECFLLGVIFGEIKPEKDAAGRIRYVWSEQIGLVGKEKTIPLGIEMRALAELISKKSTRAKLMARNRDHLDRTRRNRDLLARYNAVLGWYFDEVYPESKMQATDGLEHIEQSNMCRAVDKQIKGVENFLESSDGNQPEARQEFIRQSLKYRQDIDNIAPKLVDGKRALRLEVAAPDAAAVNVGD